MSKKLVIKAFKNPEVLAHLKRFKDNNKKLKFFSSLLDSRNFEDLNFDQVVDLVKGVAAYVDKIDEKKINSEMNFFKHRLDNSDMVRQSYGVYSPPNKKYSI